MAKNKCCEIMECNNICNNCCLDNCKNVCDENICLNVISNEKCICCVNISKNKLNCLMNEVKCETHKNKYKIICAINLGNIIYIFIQTGYNSKYNMLCVIHGTFDNVNNKIINETLKLHTKYNIYISAKGENINTNNAIKLKVTNIVYNKFNDLFAVLLCVKNTTFIATIDNFSSLDTLGCALIFLHKKSSCNLIMFKQCIHCIMPCDKNKYVIIIYDTQSNCRKSLTLHIE